MFKFFLVATLLAVTSAAPQLFYSSPVVYSPTVHHQVVPQVLHHQVVPQVQVVQARALPLTHQVVAPATVQVVPQVLQHQVVPQVQVVQARALPVTHQVVAPATTVVETVPKVEVTHQKVEQHGYQIAY